ncbi:ferritin [Seongchinamella sediminis]|uniref:Ferritin n=1 Tax=Seongchinamella sediminis TaxID=2283635 RepID=A0A3L7E4V9_9GAMM|nr:ferritin [Seongchinamella sediminis]RLQ23611.1 ferritin [Seongchinamella sediminis]
MISEAMQKALHQQLNDEFYSAYLYLAMSAYCAHIDFNGAANWLKQQYQEEQNHATRIYNYLIEQGSHVVLRDIAQPPSEFGKILDVFKSSLQHEQAMTARLNNLSDQALKEKDHATYNLLQWFVNEQVEEEATVGEIISKLKLVKDDGYGLLMIDNELGARKPPPPAPAPAV